MTQRHQRRWQRRRRCLPRMRWSRCAEMRAHNLRAREGSARLPRRKAVRSKPTRTARLRRRHGQQYIGGRSPEHAAAVGDPLACEARRRRAHANELADVAAQSERVTQRTRRNHAPRDSTAAAVQTGAGQETSNASWSEGTQLGGTRRAAQRHGSRRAVSTGGSHRLWCLPRAAAAHTPTASAGARARTLGPNPCRRSC